MPGHPKTRNRAARRLFDGVPGLFALFVATGSGTSIAGTYPVGFGQMISGGGADAPILLAQAPGAGGATVPAIPSTPSVAAPQAAPAGPVPSTSAGSGPRFEIRGFVLSGATLVSKARIDAALAPFVGANRDFGDVQRALEVIERLFIDAGFGSVQVLLPEQELDRGVVQFQVIEPKVSRIVVEGNVLFSEANVRASLPALREGQAPNSIAIGSNLRLANENPAKATTVLLRAGRDEGDVDVLVRVVEDRVVRWNLVVDNTGSGNTGSYRVGAGVQVANVFGRDHVFGAQMLTSPDERNRFRGYSRDVAILGLQYRIPIYRFGDMLDFTAGYSNANSGTVQNIFNVSGRGTVFGVRYTQNLAAIGSFEHRLIYALDLRFYENSVVPVGGGQQIVPDITVRPLSLTYAGTWRGPSHETTFYVGYSRNLPGGSFGGSGAFDMSRGSQGTGLLPSARPGYSLWRYAVYHNLATAGDWQARVGITGQYTRDMLVAGEQFGLGGANSVRGFSERQFANDYGAFANFELYTPDFARRIGIGESIKLRAVLFHDTGHVVRNEPLPGDTARVSASGTGLGLRLSAGTSLSIRLDAAFANLPSNTGNTQLPVSLKQFRMHGALVYVF